MGRRALPAALRAEDDGAHPADAAGVGRMRREAQMDAQSRGPTGREEGKEDGGQMTERTPRIVVGVDGSDNSIRALAWAAEEARLRHAELEVVHAAGYGPWYDPDLLITQSEIDAWLTAGAKVIEAALQQVPGLDGLRIRRETPADLAARALIAASKGADLLVVGSRGHGGFTGLLLGSVSNACVHHAACPVVVVGAWSRPTEAGDAERPAGATAGSDPATAVSPASVN